jgi:hypothetical protein
MRFAVRSIKRLVLTIAFAACGDREVEDLVKVRDDVCACGSATAPLACADAAMKHVPKEDVRASRRARAVAREMLDCYARYAETGRPKSDPDAEPGSSR